MKTLKLKQDQVWNLGDNFARIVRLERLEVQYKLQKALSVRDGEHVTCSKKEFCKLIKHAILLTPEEVKTLVQA